MGERQELDWFEVVLIVVVVVALLIALVRACRAWDEFDIWIYDTGPNQKHVIVDDGWGYDGWNCYDPYTYSPWPYYQQRRSEWELMQQEMDRQEWWQNDYKNMLRRRGVNEDLLMGW